MNGSFVERLRKDLPEESKLYGIEPQQTARDIMLEFRTKDGLRKAYAYSYMTMAVYDPEQGITIQVADVKVNIKGRSLENIFHYLLANRLSYVQEDFSGIDTEDKELFIEAIEIASNDNEQ